MEIDRTMKRISFSKKQDHTYDEGCQMERIHDIAVSCDNEYYMSALGPTLGNRDRAMRGLHRIEEMINELVQIKEEVTCHECQKEIRKQIRLQEVGLREIKSIWSKDK
jgi:hypothetical protein